MYENIEYWISSRTFRRHLLFPLRTHFWSSGRCWCYSSDCPCWARVINFIFKFWPTSDDYLASHLHLCSPYHYIIDHLPLHIQYCQAIMSYFLFAWVKGNNALYNVFIMFMVYVPLDFLFRSSLSTLYFFMCLPQN